MYIFWILFVGLIVGAIARLVTPGRGPGGLLVTSLLGVLGSAVAHVIGVAGGWYTQNEHAGLLASVLGAVLVLWVWRRWTRSRARARAAERRA